ncbi:MBL fold metallo-hydrolase [Bacillus sp. CGMCC 1.16607]|uniref:MBL fold metallo-hydrolase n=1 Tax=Bacillus sp. CGMCC 1.16607 TaxID=3351842 RepID=UPI00362C9B28
MGEEIFQSKHFNLREINKGVYAAIVTKNGGGVGNAGIIDLGDQTIIFDTFNTPQAAFDLKQAALQLTNNPITYVVNSHWHGDHIRGNQAFYEYEIISTTMTKELMDEIHPGRMEKQKKSLQELSDHIKSLEKEADKTKDLIEQENILNSVSQLKEIKASLPLLTYVSPSFTFEEKYIISGSKREVELISFGGGHTRSDMFLYIPNESIIFTGDLLVNGTHPYMLDGNPESWIDILEKMLILPIQVAVPGHGDIATKEELIILKEYIIRVIEAANTKELEIPPYYKSWTMPELYKLNIEFVKQWKFNN